MKEFIEKLIERLEKQKEQYKRARANTHCVITETSECDSCRADHYLKARLKCIDRTIEIVNQLAEEYNNQNIDQDLTIVESLPSLYPMMQPFEVEAINIVVSRAKDSGGWIPCIEKKPRMIDAVLVCEKDGFMTVAIRGQAGKFCDTYANVLDDVIAWRYLPEPFKEERGRNEDTKNN